MNFLPFLLKGWGFYVFLLVSVKDYIDQSWWVVLASIHTG